MNVGWTKERQRRAPPPTDLSNDYRLAEATTTRLLLFGLRA